MQPGVQHSRFKTSDGYDIAYTLRARPAPGADRVVLIHSLALDASVWDGVTARLADCLDLLLHAIDREVQRIGVNRQAFIKLRLADAPTTKTS